MYYLYIINSKYNRRLLISIIISVPRKYYVLAYLPQSTRAFTRAFNFFTGYITTSVTLFLFV